MATSSIFSDVAALQDQLRGMWRFRWAALIVAWCAALVCWAVVFFIPNTYQARAKIFVDAGTTLSQATKGISLEDNVTDQIDRVSAALLGTPQLRKVANETNLLAGAVTPEQQQAVIDGLRQRVNVIADVDPKHPLAAPKEFTITYKDGERARAIAVVDRMLNDFVEGSLQDKSQGSQVAEQFLTQQIAAYGQRLSTTEQQLAAFKKRNIALLPREGDFFGQLQTEQQALTHLRESLYVAMRKRDALAGELKSGQQFTASGPAAGSVGNATALDIEQQIEQDQQRLDRMLLKYTDKYPNVISLRESIKELKAREKQQASEAQRGNLGAASSLGLTANPVYLKLQEQYNAQQVDIASLQQQISDRQREIASLKVQMGSAPAVQAEYAQLTRNYAVTKRQYDALLARLDSARLGQQAASTGLVKFQVIDPPSANFQPVSPKRRLLIIGTFFLALGAGIGVAYLLHLLRPVFVSTRQLAVATGLPVLGEVSMAWAEKHRVQRREGTVRYALLSSALLVVAVIVLGLSGHITHVVRELLT